MFVDIRDFWFFTHTLAIVAVCYTSLAIWAGIAKSPNWFWRASALFGAVAILIPIECYEPAALFLLAMPLTFLATLSIAHRMRSVAASANDLDRIRAIRFSLRNLFQFVFLAAVGSAILAYLLRKEAFADWLSLIGQAGLLTTESTLLTAIILPCSFLKKTVAFVSATLIGLISACLPDPLLIVEYAYPSNANKGVYIGFIAIVWTVEMSLLLMFVHFASSQPLQVKSKLKFALRMVARGGLGLIGVMLTACLIFIYAKMLFRAPYPVDTFPRENALPRALALAEKLGPFSYSETAVIEVAQPLDSELERSLRRQYSEIHESLRQDGHTVLPLTANARADLASHSLRNAGKYATRGLARRWEAEAKGAASEGNYERASEYCMDLIRLGHFHARGGIMFDAVVGSAIETKGLEELAEIREPLPIEFTRKLLSNLSQIDDRREEIATTASRELAFVDRAFTWRRRLDAALNRLRGADDHFEYSPHYRKVIGRSNAKMQLLRTELAIRLYRSDLGRLPNSLSDMVPEYLSSVPLDPFSGLPLVFRRDGSNYDLYSVGEDRIDDGGKLINARSELHEAGFDLDLDLDVESRIPADVGGT